MRLIGYDKVQMCSWSMIIVQITSIVRVSPLLNFTVLPPLPLACWSWPISPWVCPFGPRLFATFPLSQVSLVSLTWWEMSLLTLLSCYRLDNRFQGWDIIHFLKLNLLSLSISSSRQSHLCLQRGVGISEGISSSNFFGYTIWATMFCSFTLTNFLFRDLFQA